MFGDSKSSAQATEKSSHGNWVQEGLEVAPNGSDAPIFVAGGPGVDHGRLLRPEEVSQPEGTIHLIDSRNPEPIEIGPSERTLAQAMQSDIFRLKRRRLFLSVLIALIVIGAIIGGAVGGTKGSCKSEPATVTVSPENINGTPTSLATSTSSVSPKPIMSFKLQTWENPGYQGRSQIFYTPGGYRTSFLAKSYHWEPGNFSDKLRCSLAICFNNNGWWGMSERFNPGNSINTNPGVIYAHIACAEGFKDPGCPGPDDVITYTTIPVIETTWIDPSKILPLPISTSTRT